MINILVGLSALVSATIRPPDADAGKASSTFLASVRSAQCACNASGEGDGCDCRHHHYY